MRRTKPEEPPILPLQDANVTNSRKETWARNFPYLLFALFLLVALRYGLKQEFTSEEETLPLPIERNSLNLCYEPSDSQADAFWIPALLETARLLNEASQYTYGVYTAIDVNQHPHDCFVRVVILPEHEEVEDTCNLPNPIACSITRPHFYQDKQRHEMRIIAGGTQEELESEYGEAFTNPEPCRTGPGVLLHEMGHQLGYQHDFSHPIMTTGCTKIEPEAIQAMFFPGLSLPNPR